MPNQTGVVPDVLSNGTLLPDNPYLAASILGSTPFDPAQARLQQTGAGIVNAASDIGNNLASFLRVPGDVATGKYSLDEITKLAPGYALGLAGFSSPIGAALVPEDSLGIFAGSKSLTHSPAALERANILETYGKSPEDILALTNQFRGPEGQWRTTISDENAALKLDRFNKIEGKDWYHLYSTKKQTLGDVLHHPELFAAYPHMADYPVRYLRNDDLLSGLAGSFLPESKTFELAGGKSKDLLSTLLHEIQHGIQTEEEFPRGGSSTEFLPEDFFARIKRQRANVKDTEALIKDFYPELSDTDRVQIGNMLRGYTSPKSKEVLNKLGPLFRPQVEALASESTALKLDRMDAEDKYKRLAGEVEARAVEEQLSRGDWTTPIWKHEGYIPFSQQIIKTPGMPGYNVVPVEHDPFVTNLVPVDHNPFEEKP